MATPLQRRGRVRNSKRLAPLARAYAAAVLQCIQFSFAQPVNLTEPSFDNAIHQWGCWQVNTWSQDGVSTPGLGNEICNEAPNNGICVQDEQLSF